jgi:RimJ/RimL family protein N-acetyltransferase
MIKTKHLNLRPLQQEDAAPLERELNNFNITRNTGRVPYPYSNQDAVEYLQFVSQQPAQSCIRAITLKDQLIGVIGYLYSIEKQDAELGYWLSEQHWGKGFVRLQFQTHQNSLPVFKTKTQYQGGYWPSLGLWKLVAATVSQKREVKMFL